MSDGRKQLDIAIVGGGIGGLALALGLINKNFNVTIYEAAHRFGEIGAGVMFSPNAVRAMKLIDPRLEEGCKKSANDKIQNGLYFRHAYHPSTGEGDYRLMGSSYNPEEGLLPVSRTDFLEELVKLVPVHTAHFNKRLEEMMQNEDGQFSLRFKDGTTARHQIVLGADGIHSQVRKYVLGPDSPDLEPRYSGQSGYRGRVPMDKAIEILGEDLATKSTCYMGEGKHIVSYCVGGGKFLNLTPNYYKSTWDEKDWKRPSSHEEVRETYKGFPEKLLRLLDQMENPTLSGLHHLPEAETYYRGNVAIIGDAAHATTPFQGAGAGMAIEDAYVLSGIFDSVETVGQVEGALAAYDAVRRPRTLKLVRTSVENAAVMNYQHPDTGFDAAKISKNVAERYRWIWEEDLPAEVEAARKIMAGLE